MVIGSLDQEASQRFFTEGLGFKVSDQVPGLASFMRCSTDHHNLLVQQAPVNFLHHTAWEVDDVDEVGRGATAMLEGHPERHVWGLGRHHIGSNFFWYLKDPVGNFSEYYSDLDIILDDQLWEPSVVEGARGLYNWGPLPAVVHSARGPGRVDDRKPRAQGLTLAEDFMRIGRAHGRLVIIDGDGVIDAATVSDGEFSADPDRVFAVWDRFTEWAGGYAGPAAATGAGAGVGAPVQPAPGVRYRPNYRGHVAESGVDVPDVPPVFTKWRSCVAGPTPSSNCPARAWTGRSRSSW